MRGILTLVNVNKTISLTKLSQSGLAARPSDVGRNLKLLAPTYPLPPTPIPHPSPSAFDFRCQEHKSSSCLSSERSSPFPLVSRLCLSLCTGYTTDRGYCTLETRTDWNHPLQPSLWLPFSLPVCGFSPNIPVSASAIERGTIAWNDIIPMRSG